MTARLGGSGVLSRRILDGRSGSTSSGGSSTSSTTSTAAPAAQDPAQPVPTPDPGPTAEQQSAKASLTAALDSYGLGSLADWAWGEYLNGVPTEQIMLDLRKRPEYAARFPGMAALSKQGRAISEAEYINLERSYAQQMRAYGLPADFYDSADDFAKLIAGDVSAQEFGDRLQMAQQAALTDPRGQVLRDQLSRIYGISGSVGAITAYWIDPDKSAALLKQQFAAAQAATDAATTGFGSLTKEQAEKVGGLGLSAGEQQQVFGNLADLGSLRTGLIGDAGSVGVTQDEMVNVIAGDKASRDKLQNEQKRRVAAFQGGGGFAGTQGGLSGLGTAS